MWSFTTIELSVFPMTKGLGDVSERIWSLLSSTERVGPQGGGASPVVKIGENFCIRPKCKAKYRKTIVNFDVSDVEL